MINIKINKENVLEFLQDEGLTSSFKIKENPPFWTIYINDPFVDDNKQRMGISYKYFEEDGQERVIFNGWKSTALLGDDYHGDFYKFVKLYKNFSSFQEAKLWFNKKYIFRKPLKEVIKKEVEKKEVVKSELYWDEKFERLSLKKKTHKPFIEYLFKRKISVEKINETKIFIDKKSKRLIFPVYENEDLIFYTKRSIVPHFLPWIKATKEGSFPIWNLDNIDEDIVYLFEGIFDAINIKNGVAILGVAHEEVAKKIASKNFLKYVIVLDNDEAGRKAKIHLAEILSNDYNKDVYIYNYKGINEQYKDFSEMMINNIDLEMDTRVIPYDFKTKTLIKMGKVI
jgi:hypothetical protein